MFDWTSTAEWKRLWRYYQVGVVNTLFGYAIFAALIRLGVNVFAAQIVSHISGVVFNYFTYSRFAFSGYNSRLVNFALAYAFNYAVSFVVLFVVRNFIESLYLCGLIATIIASLVNYFVLKGSVFRRKVTNEQGDG
jgi:putative flippase GtrA